MAFKGVFNNNNQKAYDAYKKDKQFRQEVIANPAVGRTNFVMANRATNARFAPTNYQSDSQRKKGKSYKWESEMLHALPKSYGKSYNDKFTNFTKGMGLNEVESKRFRTFLDAKEKGLLNRDQTNQYLNDMDSKARFNATPENDNPIVPKKRTGLDRTFDTLLMGNYMSANVANNIFNEKDGLWEGLKEGVMEGAKAGTPWGEGYEDGEMTYSKVFEKGGWKPQTWGGKLARGTAGFVADVLLDPTSYMTFGASALIKGSGKSAISASKLLKTAEGIPGITDDAKKLLSKGTMTPDVAKEIVKNQNLRTGRVLDEEQLIQEAQKLSTRFHEVLGTNRSNAGLGIGLKHSLMNPILKGTLGRGNGRGAELVRKIADSHIELPGTARFAEGVSNAFMIDRGYAQLRKKIYGGKIGKLLSNKHGLIKLTETAPERLYDTIDMLERAKGLKLDKMAEQRMVHDYVKQNLDTLDPADQKKLIEALQDKTILKEIKRAVQLKDMDEVKAMRRGAVMERNSIIGTLDALRTQKQELEQFKATAESGVEGAKDVYRQAERDYFDNLNKLNLDQIKDEEHYNTAMKLLQEQSEALEKQIAELPPTPAKPEEVTLNASEPAKPKRPYTKNDVQIPKYEELPIKEAYPKKPELSDFVSNDVTELQYNGSGVLDKWFAKGENPKSKDVVEMADEFSKLIFDEPGKISLVTYPRDLTELAKLIEEGRNTNYIRNYIDARKMYYDGRASDIFQYVARKFKYGKDNGSKFQSWKEFYFDRVTPIKQALEAGKEISSADRKLLNKLETIRAQRAIIVKEMSDMNHAELKQFFKEESKRKMNRDFDEVANSAYYPGKEEFVVGEDGVMRRITGQKRIKSQSDLDRERRERFSDEDMAVGNVSDASTKITGGFLPEGMTMEDTYTRMEKVDGKYGKEVELEKRYYIDPETKQEIEYKPLSAKNNVPDKDFRTGEFRDVEGDKQYFELDLRDEHKDEIIAQVIQNLHYIGKKRKTTNTFSERVYRDVKIGAGHARYANDVVEVVPEVLQQYFPYKQWDELSKGAKKFVISFAELNRNLRLSGKEAPLDNIGKMTPEMKKELKEQMKIRGSIVHSEAIRSMTEIGSPVVLGSSYTGKVTGIRVDEDGVTHYMVKKNKGDKAEVEVTAKDILKVGNRKPADIVLENSFENQIYQQLDEATKLYEAEVKRIDDEFHQKSQEVYSKNSELADQYKVDKEKLKETKKQKKEEYNAQMEEYQKQLDDFSAQKAEVEAINMRNFSDWEDAIRKSSMLADDLLTRKQELIKEMQDLTSMYKSSDGAFDVLVEKYTKDLDDHYTRSVESIAHYEKLMSDYDKQLNDLASGNVDTAKIDTRLAELQAKYDDDVMKHDALPDEIEIDEVVPTGSLGMEIDNARNHVERIQNAINGAQNPTSVKSLQSSLKKAQDKLDSLMAQQVVQKVRKPNGAKEIHKQSMESIKKQMDSLNVQRQAILDRGAKSVDDMIARRDELNDMLKSDEAFESWMEVNKKAQINALDKKYNGENVGKLVIDTRNDYSDTVKRLAKELRDRFKLIGADEVMAGKMTEEQFASWVDEYLPHLVTPSGKKFFKDWKLEWNPQSKTTEVVARTKQDTVPSITQDLGYGEKYSDFNMSRQIKKLKMPDGRWVERPTIEQINEVMRPYIKGGENAFSEAISDIYLTRALKHSELMYDNKYMEEMMTRFGDDLPADFVPKKGFKAVMNFGLFRQNISEMAGLQTSLRISSDVSAFVKEELAGKVPQEQWEDEIGKFIEREFPKERMDEIRNTFHDQGYEMMGLQRDTFRSIATPMVEMNPQQMMDLDSQYKGVLNEFLENFERIKGNAERHGASESMLERIAKTEERITNLKPLEMKQIHETLVDKANQARAIQVAKDKNKMVMMYDKFTHFMKLNQTAVMPSFHARNAMSNMFQVWLAVGNDIFDMATHKQVISANFNTGNREALKTIPPLIVRNKAGQEIGRYDWQELVDIAQSHGVVDEGFFAKDLGANDASNGVFKWAQDVRVPKTDKHISLDPTDTKNNVVYKTGSSVGSVIENQARLFQFASHIKNGMSPEQAKAMVDKYLFDYSDLTHFEQNVMKRIFPYYTWLRKNGRLQVSQVLEQPGKYRDVAKFMNGVEGGVNEEDKVEDQYLSKFAQNWKQTIFNYTTVDEDGNEVVEPVLWNPNLPFMDLTRLPSANPVDTLKTMLPQTNPLIKGVAELGTNKNFFFDDRIWESEDSEGNPTSAMYKAGKIAEYGASQFAPYTAIRDTFKKDGLDRNLHLLNTVAGQKLLSYDYQTSKDMIISKYLGKSKEKELWVDKQLNKIDNFPVKLQGHTTKILTDYVNGNPSSSVAQFINKNSFLEKTVLNNDITMAKVTGVRDGDTIEVEYKGKIEPVRFNLVDTPEISHNANQKAMPFADEGYKLTKSLAEGKDVRLVISNQRDMHGRLMAYVYVDGEDMGKKLLNEGLASVRYANLSTNPYNLEEYKKAQQSASDSNTGLWQLEGYADPDKEGYNMRGAMKRYLELMGQGE